MNLPIIKGFKNAATHGRFKGVDGVHVTDMVNLSCLNNCSTRKTRAARLFLEDPPDQIIECSDCVYLRYGDTLKKVIVNSDSEIFLQDMVYQLTEHLIPLERKIIEFDGKTYVLPDNLQIGKDSWTRFARNDRVSTSLPFVDPRTLVYPEDQNNTFFCNDALSLKVGMKLRFSCLPNEIYTIIMIELRSTTLETGEAIVTGRRITLDKGVDFYNAMPADTIVTYCDPENRPIFNSLRVGYHHTIDFRNNRIIFTPDSSGYSICFEEYFKIGQTVDIVGDALGSNQKSAKITNIVNNCIYFDKNFVAYTEPPKVEITITAKIPYFDHCLITENRLFGADNVIKKFYISELNNPFVFTDSSIEPNDSWSVNLTTSLSGIALWKDSVICFTEDGGFRVLGYNATNFGIRQLSVNGVKRGFCGSLCRVGDTLYYYSSKGVMKYSGGSDTLLFDASLPIKQVKKSITDGASVYMLTDDRIWVYDTSTKTYWSEDGENISYIFTVNGYNFYYSNGTIYSTDSDLDYPINWSFTLKNIPPDKEFKIDPLYLTLYFSSDTDCAFSLYTKSFGKSEFENCGSYSVKGEGSVKIKLQSGICDEIQIMAKGVGKFSPESWLVGYRKI